ncbi:MAG TPA: helix-turn-helix transcriptional regulator, partial [Chromatiaceae bacterium]|nr:helix-turn-helix transcriptional regulator [Chromatiaceae bacterium]
MTDAFDSGRATGSVPGRAPGGTSGRAPGSAPGSATVPPSPPGAASDADLPNGPGQRLRQARLRRNLELRQVAREMRLTVERVQAIEEDDYAALPDPVFVAGYLKTYARLMDLN